MPADRVAETGDPAPLLHLAKESADGVSEDGPYTGILAGDLAIACDRRDGAIRHVLHRPTGRDFADARQRRPLFTLRLTRWQKGETTELSSADFRLAEWTGADARTRTATFRDSPITGLVVRATLAAGTDGLAHFQLAIENPSDQAVAAIRYPGFVSPAALGGDAADRMATTVRSGRH